MRAGRAPAQARKVNSEQQQAWLTLLRSPGLGPAALARLLEAFGDAQTALGAGPRRWRSAGLDEAQAAALASPDRDGVAQDLAWLAGAGRHLVTWSDPAYPPQLRHIPQAPPALFCQGDLELLRRPQVALVGARSASPQGIENAKAFAGALAARGLVVTSGLALGIDGAAHRGALAADGLTLAVCATGLDRVYPARHRELALEIAARGLLVSEFPTGVQALPDHFPRRNRIIAGLALGVVVVEAARESGSLITARLASEQGREVFAIPGSIHNPMARGCHALIRQGAKLVETVDDILEELGPQIGAALRVAPPGVVRGETVVSDPLQARLLALLDDAPQTVDAVALKLELAIEPLQAALLHLELAGAIAPLAGGAWQRVR